MKRIIALLLSLLLCLSVISACSSEKVNISSTEKAILSALIDELKNTVTADVYAEALSRAQAVLEDKSATSAQVTGITDELLKLRNEYLNKTINFTDRGAEHLIKHAMGKADTESISLSEAGMVSELDLTYDPSNTEGLLPITNTTDFTYFRNLKKLILAGNEITDISGLLSLTKLTELNLSFNKIADISPISGLTSLKSLNISFNEITSLSSLFQVLPFLSSLDASSNPITSFENLKLCKTLETLVLDGYSFSSLDFLYGIETLDKLYLRRSSFSESVELKNLIYISYLDISDASGFRIDDVASLTNLKSLIAKNNKITDASFTSKMLNLTELDLSKNLLESFEFYGNVPALTKVNLSQNSLSNVVVVSYSALSDLDISQNELTNISFENLPALRKVNLSQNRLTTIDISSLSALEILDLSHNEITDTSFISSNTIKTMLIKNNYITSFSAVLPSLKILDISDNQDLSVTSLSMLVPLVSLDISGISTFENLSFLAPLINLKILKVDCSNATDKTLPSTLTSLEEVYIYGADDNSVSSLYGFTYLKKLEISGGTLVSPQIRGFRYLTHLTISEIPFSDLSGISDLEKLEDIYIKGATLENPLISNFPALKRLSLVSCGITSFSGITGLLSLTYFNASQNNPQSFIFAELPKLKYLDLSSCSIEHITDFYLPVTDCVIILNQNSLTELSGLVPLKKILILDISQNNITDYSALDGITVTKIIK
ncbi:MAG: hypothetical protein DBX47_01110 [Clostridiales bacterium]|nr:MAG: hypothetical protein DBX47_01110 [Clostridiales bacterium]